MFCRSGGRCIGRHWQKVCTLYLSTVGPYHCRYINKPFRLVLQRLTKSVFLSKVHTWLCLCMDMGNIVIGCAFRKYSCVDTLVFMSVMRVKMGMCYLMKRTLLSEMTQMILTINLLQKGNSRVKCLSIVERGLAPGNT